MDMEKFNETQAKVDRLKNAFGPIVKSWTPRTGEIKLNNVDAILSLLDRVEALELSFQRHKYDGL